MERIPDGSGMPGPSTIKPVLQRLGANCTRGQSKGAQAGTTQGIESSYQFYLPILSDSDSHLDQKASYL